MSYSPKDKTHLVRPKSLKQTLTNRALDKIWVRIKPIQHLKKMLNEKKNLVEMSPRLNRSEPIIRTIRELPGIGRTPRTRDDVRLGRNLPIDFLIVRQK